MLATELADQYYGKAGDRESHAHIARRVEVGFAAFTMLWCFLFRKAWHRQEAILAYRWTDDANEGAGEKPLPQVRLERMPGDQ